MEGEDEGTPAENEETPEAPETPDEPAADTDADTDPEPVKVSITELLTTKQPEWLQARLDMEQREITEDDLRGLDANAHRVIAALVAQGKAGGEEFTAKQTELREKEQELAIRERAVQRRQAEGLKWATDPKVRAFVDSQKPAGEAPTDPFSPEFVAWKAREQAHDMISKFFGTFTAIEADARKAAEQAEADAAAAAEQDRMAAYCEEHVESLNEPVIFDHVKALMGKGHDIEEAHRIALALVATSEVADVKAEALKASRARVGRGGRTAVGTIPSVPKGLTLDERNEWREKHPDATKAEVEARFRRGVGY